MVILRNVIECNEIVKTDARNTSPLFDHVWSPAAQEGASIPAQVVTNKLQSRCIFNQDMQCSDVNGTTLTPEYEVLYMKSSLSLLLHQLD